MPKQVTPIFTTILIGIAAIAGASGLVMAKTHNQRTAVKHCAAKQLGLSADSITAKVGLKGNVNDIIVHDPKSGAKQDFFTRIGSDGKPEVFGLEQNKQAAPDSVTARARASMLADCFAPAPGKSNS